MESSDGSDGAYKLNEYSEIIQLYNIPFIIKTYYEESNYLINTKESRIVISVVLLLVFIMSDIITRLFFGTFGFVISYKVYCAYDKTGEYAWGMIKSDTFHIHHWLYCSIILITITLLGIAHPFMIGLCFGGITHGIQFSDWHIIYKS